MAAGSAGRRLWATAVVGRRPTPIAEAPPVTPRSSPALAAGEPPAPRLCFLVIDTRFAVPVFVFLDSDPTGAAGYAGPPARRVTLSGAPGQRLGEGVEPWRTVGADPER